MTDSEKLDAIVAQLKILETTIDRKVPAATAKKPSLDKLLDFAKEHPILTVTLACIASSAIAGMFAPRRVPSVLVLDTSSSLPKVTAGTGT